MIRYLRKLREIVRPIYNSIGFVPSLMCFLFFLLALFALQLEKTVVDQWLAEHFSWTQIDTADTARAIMSTIAGGVISLTVFSFSMVMVVLSQATANFSPRLLPGLISDRRNQTVLGTYLGTIIYAMVIMFNVRSIDNNYEVPSVGVLVAVMLMGWCMGLFIFFIHSISSSIQISTVLQSIYDKTLNYLNQAEQSDTDLPAPYGILHHPIYAPTSGYLQDIRQDALVKCCAKNNLLLGVAQIQGDFVMKGEILAYTDKAMDDRDLIDTLQNHFVFYNGEWIADNYIYGFKHLSEVAVKALSPGINDPATAISAINHLGVLFQKYLLIKEHNPRLDAQGSVRLIIRNHHILELLQRTLGPIRFYGKADVQVMERLFWLMGQLHKSIDPGSEKDQALYAFTKGIYESAQRYIELPQDRNSLNQQLELINACLPEHYQLALLQSL
jgi:uncharacterized membrane protein